MSSGLKMGMADNHVRREITNSESTTVADHQRGVIYSNPATSADQQKVTRVQDYSTTFLDSHKRRAVTNSTNEDNAKFNSATIVYKEVINSDSFTIAEIFRRKEVTNSTSNDKNVTFDSATIAKVAKTDSATIADNLGQRKTTSSESTTIADDQRDVTYSDSATISDSMTIIDYRNIAADYRRQRPPPAPGLQAARRSDPPPTPQFTLPSLAPGETYDPSMTFPKDLQKPTPADTPHNPIVDSQSRTKSNRVLTTFPIRYPIMPKLDEHNTEPCDVIAYFCLKSYKTGKVCGRASNFVYKTFENYCMIDYVNCKERTNVWKIIYMGECIPKPTEEEQARHLPPLMYEYHDDYFLDDILVIDERFHEDIMEKLEPIHNPVTSTASTKPSKIIG